MNNFSPITQTQQIIRNSVTTQQIIQNSNKREVSSKEFFMGLSLLLTLAVIGIFIIKKVTKYFYY